MFTKFLETYAVTTRVSEESLRGDGPNLKKWVAADDVDFLERYQGTIFGDGIYRLHRLRDVPKWSGLVAEAFPRRSNDLLCFGCDWLGRQFALDAKRLERGMPLVLMLEPGTGQALQIPYGFRSFHNECLVEEADAALACDFFQEWREGAGISLSFDQCVGYKVPLFLGGKDTSENLEVCDLEVYWQISSQLWNKVRHLPEGTKLGEIGFQA